jgi:MoCo/4Fe-4S cofactor protein with predicted Tat translocation signal
MSDFKNLKGKKYWRSLNELEKSPEFSELLHREFPQGASELTNPVTRRNFLTIMGASIALAGVTGCRKPVEKIIPYVIQPEEVVPGMAQYYATTMPFGNSAYGLLVESHEGRPTKIEGNKQHPSSLGGTNPFIQASILGLFDPDRSQRVLHNRVESSWDDFVTAWRMLHVGFFARQGEGLAVLCEAFSSPTLARLKAEFVRQFPRAVWVTYESVSDENIYGGIRIATGKTLRPIYAYDKAEVIVSLDADFLFGESENVAAAKGFADGRRISSEHDSMNRLYVAESVYSVTGTMADHRLRLTSSQVAPFAAGLVVELQRQGLAIPISDQLGVFGRIDFDREWLTIAASDLIAARGKCIVVAGRRQPPIVHALVFAINQALGNVNATISYNEFVDAEFPSRIALTDLSKKMLAGQVDTLVMIGGNVVYNAPTDCDFAGALSKVENTIQLSQYINETSHSVSWHLPEAHYLEYWGDARAADGTVSMIQPLILPLFGGHSPIELLQLLANGRDARGYDIVRQTWSKILTGNFEKEWQRVLHDGRLAKSSIPTVTPLLDEGAIAKQCSAGMLKKNTSPFGTVEIVFQPSPAMFDGRYANNGWLQETPDPITKITWDNVAAISPATARELGIRNGEIVRMSHKGRSLEIAAWLVPGQPDGMITLELGYGRNVSGRVGNGIGFDVGPLRTLEGSDFIVGVAVTTTGRTYPISCAQDHGSMEGRPLVREATLEEYRKEPKFAQEMVEHPPLKSLWDEHDYSQGYQWGLTVDLNTCIGCGACTLACQSENNIPIVGKTQVAKGREMNWIRVDRYFSGEADDAQVMHQPVMCQHCENAPCEQVCPVAATVHDKEGLNLMVYNRCIGTRYCSNNCPYKVRRFNFFNYTKDTPEIVKMAMNPDVTVRSRGVMEKCTFCIQRINRGKNAAKLENREVRDGEIVTACQQACPTHAIVFGNINDPASRVSIAKHQNRNYELLAELNTKPRLSYLARIRNPHPKLG